MKNKNRYREIDLLRGIAILAMILIHTTYYFLGDKTALFIWKWSQFAVPVFIFCSAYIFFQNPKKSNFEYLKKRIYRLLKPYYLFLLFFIPVIYFVNHQVLTPNYIIQSLIIAGGVDISWLVLLFVFLTFIFPLISLSFEKYKFLFWTYSLISFISSIFLIFYKLPFSYKFIFWLPWSVIPIFTLFFVLHEHKKNFLNYLIIGSGLVFTSSYYLEKFVNHNLGMYENKYPPTIYFLAYGIFMICISYILSNLLKKNKTITRILSFFSMYSYSIFFVHYLLLIILANYRDYFKFNWITFFLSILFITIIIQSGFNSLKSTRAKS